ncbi:MAG: hypothetical protein IT373_22435 [Polyangiaceae bacterium]|nr:hypothetical protein [Polyangiaceae bacterium]
MSDERPGQPGRELEPRWLAQMAHLTTPATVWKYVEGACQRSRAQLVMLDLEDSIPRDDRARLEAGRAHVARAVNELDWGGKLRCFRPRGAELDPELEDVRAVVAACGGRLDGLVYPKVESPAEVVRLDAALAAAERTAGLPEGHIRVELLIESVRAEEHAFVIAATTPRLAGLVFGAFDYWSSLGMGAVPYRFDHPLLDEARRRVVKAAASVGVPAIAEMTVNYPTRDKSAAEQRAALDECRRDAHHARDLGFRGKWTGIPAQVDVVLEVFALAPEVVARAVELARRYRAAEAAGRGAVMIDGVMADRALDRVARTTLAQAHALGALDDATARELEIPGRRR